MSRLTTLSLAVLCACTGGDQPRSSTLGQGSGAPLVYVTNYPLEYFAQRIGGGIVQIEFPMAGGGDPAFWQPDAETIRRMQSADIILTNGATYERWLDQVTLPTRRIVNTSAAFADQYLEVTGSVTHTHGPEGEGSDEGTAFTTWLDPAFAVLQAEAIAESFSERWPTNAAAFEANMTAVRTDLERLDRDLRDATNALREVPLVASRPVYQYLAARYGLDIESVTWEPDTMPSERAWRAVRDLRRRHAASWMIWETEPTPEIADRLREFGMEPVVVAPLGDRPKQGDYLDGMAANIERLGTLPSP